MTEALLETAGVCKRFGALVVSNDISLRVARGSTHAIIGPNGAGKSTLMAQLAGELAPDAGRIFFDGVDISSRSIEQRARLGIARTFQLTALVADFTAEDNVALAVASRAARGLDLVHVARADRTLRDPARALLERVGLGARSGVPAGKLSHGERRVLELGVALATQPRLLLLDEPLAGMGHDEGRAMIARLQTVKRETTIVLVEHDMDAVAQLADVVSVLVGGAVIAHGTYAQVRDDRAVRDAYLGAHA